MEIKIEDIIRIDFVDLGGIPNPYPGVEIFTISNVDGEKEKILLHGVGAEEFLLMVIENIGKIDVEFVQIRSLDCSICEDRYPGCYCDDKKKVQNI